MSATRCSTAPSDRATLRGRLHLPAVPLAVAEGQRIAGEAFAARDRQGRGGIQPAAQQHNWPSSSGHFSHLSSDLQIAHSRIRRPASADIKAAAAQLVRMNRLEAQSYRRDGPALSIHFVPVPACPAKHGEYTETTGKGMGMAEREKIEVFDNPRPGRDTGSRSAARSSPASVRGRASRTSARSRSSTAPTEAASSSRA